MYKGGDKLYMDIMSGRVSFLKETLPVHCSVIYRPVYWRGGKHLIPFALLINLNS